MAWRIDFTRNADKAMRKLDKGVAARVFDELDEIAKLEDPRSRGKALTGNLAGVWRYRVGDYRILCDINDGRLVILVVDAVGLKPRNVRIRSTKRNVHHVRITGSLSSIQIVRRRTGARLSTVGLSTALSHRSTIPM